MEQGEQAQIIPFRQRDIERINGIALDLGKMTLLELQVLEVQCSERFQDVHHELTVVRDVLDRRFPDGRVS
jgi:hypothetical protein